MKNKLLTTTAIAGLLVSGAAFAQTTVTGNLELTYKGISNKSNKAASMRGFGKETQINLTNKGKLNNGMDYVAGFSIEHEGQEAGSQASHSTAGTAMFNENVYIDFISGNTTITIGADHIQNPDYEITNLVGAGDLDEIVSGINGTGTGSFITNIGSPYQAFGVGLTQNVGVGRVSIYYAPSTSHVAGDSAGGFGTASSYIDGTNSSYEVGFRGDLGVKGLDAGLFYNSTDSNDRAFNTNSFDAYKASLKYTAGAFTVAGAIAEQDANSATVASLTTTKQSKSVGLAFAASKELSLGIAHGRTDSGATASPIDEKITAVSVGYSLGPVGLGLSVGKVDGYNHTDVDGKTAMINLKTNF
jgi:hypothetical protein